jgi:hypothetical protein
MLESGRHRIAQPSVRASMVLGRLDWVRKHHGEAGAEVVLEELAAQSPDHARLIRAAVVPSLWVPFPAVVAFIESIDRVFGRGDLALVAPLAAHAARTNMPLLYRIFYKLGSVEYIMGKAAAVWLAHYDSGRATTKSIPGGMRFSVIDFATPHRVHCLTVLGWAQEMIVLCDATMLGGREVQCRLNGDAVCEFEVMYEQ